MAELTDDQRELRDKITDRCMAEQRGAPRYHKATELIGVYVTAMRRCGWPSGQVMREARIMSRAVVGALDGKERVERKARDRAARQAMKAAP